MTTQQHNVAATKAARAQARIAYQRARGEMIERHNSERRDLNKKHEVEAAELWRAYCAENAKVVV